MPLSRRGKKSNVSTRVIQALADSTGTDAGNLPPLYESVDPDALVRLVESLDDPKGSIKFSHADHRLLISADGGVAVKPDE